MTSPTKYLIVGTERSGSTLLSSLLANAEADFGFAKNREWYRGSGDYEHQIIIDTHKHLKRHLFYKSFSNRLARKEEEKVIANMKSLYLQVSYAKYPPLCEYLPLYIKQAGFDVRLLVIIRKFNDFAVSRLSKNGGNYNSCKSVYLNMYQTTLLNLSLYGGCIVRYEDVIDPAQTRWATQLSQITGLSARQLLDERDKNAKPTIAKNAIQEMYIDRECEDLYNIYTQFTNEVYLPDKIKQHK